MSERVTLTRMVRTHPEAIPEKYTFDIPLYTLSSALSAYAKSLNDGSEGSKLQIIQDILQRVKNCELYLESYPEDFE